LIQYLDLTDDNKKQWFEKHGYSDIYDSFDKLSTSSILKISKEDLERYYQIRGVALFNDLHTDTEEKGILSYPILSYPILSYPILSYPIHTNK
jgi:hypothetical protein